MKLMQRAVHQYKHLMQDFATIDPFETSSKRYSNRQSFYQVQKSIYELWNDKNINLKCNSLPIVHAKYIAWLHLESKSMERSPSSFQKRHHTIVAIKKQSKREWHIRTLVKCWRDRQKASRRRVQTMKRDSVLYIESYMFVVSLVTTFNHVYNTK
jgi:hypothetical protein